MRSLVFPWLHFWAFSHSSCYLCLTPDCPTLELWTCACDLDLCLVLFTSLLCLWYSCYARWPLPVWFCRCLINIYHCTWIPCLWPVFTVSFSIKACYLQLLRHWSRPGFYTRSAALGLYDLLSDKNSSCWFQGRKCYWFVFVNWFVAQKGFGGRVVKFQWGLGSAG